jgi:hydroxyacylglutathione hydrolase
MNEKIFGPIRFIPGDNSGRYPYCNSIYIDDAGVLIDPSANKESLLNIKEGPGVNEVWVSHCHEDHFKYLYLFDDTPLLTSVEDARAFSDAEIYMDQCGIEKEEYRDFRRDLLNNVFRYKKRIPDGFLKDGDVIQLGSVTVEVIHTPGHTLGNLSFYFKEPGILYMNDYDLSSFGPMYGNRESTISDVITSINRLRNIPANIWITGHDTGLIEENPGSLWDDYLGVIDERNEKLLHLLAKPKTFQEIADACIVYGRPLEPAALYRLAEEVIMKKHLNNLLEGSFVIHDEGRYVRA